jgi:hypothetical protein
VVALGVSVRALFSCGAFPEGGAAFCQCIGNVWEISFYKQINIMGQMTII